MSINGILHEISPRLLQQLREDPNPGPLIDAILAYEPGQAPAKTDVEILMTLLTPALRRALSTPKLRAAYEAQVRRNSLRSPGMQEYLEKRRGRSIDPADVGEILDLEKAWHGVHFLLCGDPESGPSSLGSAVLGGSAVGPDRGYGPARLLSSGEVRAVAKALALLAPSEIMRRYDPAALRRAKIYPSGWSKEDRKEWLAVAVLSTQSFYTRVAARGNATLLALS